MVSGHRYDFSLVETTVFDIIGTFVQVHKLEDATVGVFSRNSEDMSKKYPDLMEQLPHVSLRPIPERTP